MPSWFTHLSTAREVGEKLKIKDMNSFLIGNLMPDAERHVVQDFSIYVPYEVSHFASMQYVAGGQSKLPSIDKFLNKYKEKLDNEVVLGYFVHLLTDFYWNNMVFTRYVLRDNLGNSVGLKLNDGTSAYMDKDLRAKVKHTDFASFEKSLIQDKKYMLPNLDRSVDIDEIEEVPYNYDDIYKMVTFCENKIKSNEINDSYKLFTKQQIEEDYEKSIDFIIENLKNI